jgi:uncharacterized protein DUF3108
MPQNKIKADGYYKYLHGIYVLRIIIVLLWVTISSTPVVYAETLFPPLFEASYALVRNHMTVGKLERSLIQGSDGEFIYRSTSQTTGLTSLFYKLNITEEAHWNLVDDNLRPIKYYYKRLKKMKVRTIETRFDWKDMQALNIENGEKKVINIETGMVDKLSYQIKIMRDLNKGQYPSTYTIVDSNKIKVYNFKFLGKEAIETPLGNFKTLKFLIQKIGDKRKSIFWCSSQHDYLPIKVDSIEKNGVVTIAIIDSFKSI